MVPKLGHPVRSLDVTSDDERASWDFRRHPPQHPLKAGAYAERQRVLREMFAKFPELRRRYGRLDGDKPQSG